MTFLGKPIDWDNAPETASPDRTPHTPPQQKENGAKAPVVNPQPPYDRGQAVKRKMTENKRIHLNWSGCRDWLAARATLRPIVGRDTTLYGTFADVSAEPGALKAQLQAAGFLVSDEIPGRFEHARFVLYRAVQ